MTWRARFRLLVLSGLALPVSAYAGWGDPFGSLHPVELGWTRALQSIGDVAWLAKGLSALGPGSLMWAAIVAVFFGVNPRLGTRLAIFTLVALWFRECLALALLSPRPYWLDPAIRSFGDVATRRATHGLPSGHALVGTAFWLYVAAEVRRGGVWLLAALVIPLICVSRVYLGVHFVTDVSLGIVVGALLTFGYRRAEPGMLRWFESLAGRQCLGVGLALAAGVLMFAIGLGIRELVSTEPIPAAWLNFGTVARRAGIFALLGGGVAGLGLGLALTTPTAWRLLAEAGSWRQRLARIAVAGAIGYGVSRLSEFAGISGATAASEGPLRLMGLFLLTTVEVLGVWLGLPRLLRWVRVGGTDVSHGGG